MEQNRPNNLSKSRKHRNQEKFDEDYKFGIEGEMFSQPHLEKKYGKLKKTKQFDAVDFYNRNYWIELKSRRYNHDAFDYCGGLFFNYDKIEKVEMFNQLRRAKGKSQRKVIFAFNCYDGLYIWNYDGGQYTTGHGGRTDRNCDETGKVAKVLSKDMILIQEKENPFARFLLDSSDEED